MKSSKTDKYYVFHNILPNCMLNIWLVMTYVKYILLIDCIHGIYGHWISSTSKLSLLPLFTHNYLGLSLNYFNNRVTEDECHLLISCPFYSHERNIFCNNCNININLLKTNVEKKYYIMTLNDENAVFYPAKFLYKCFRKREDAN